MTSPWVSRFLLSILPQWLGSFDGGPHPQNFTRLKTSLRSERQTILAGGIIIPCPTALLLDMERWDDQDRLCGTLDPGWEGEGASGEDRVKTRLRAQ